MVAPRLPTDHRSLRRGRSLWRNKRGQSLVELTLILPALLIAVMGLVEMARMIDAVHQMRGIAREGASLASRGVALDSVLSVVVTNADGLGIPQKGGVIVSAVEVQDRAPVVQEQTASDGYAGSSAMGAPGEVATPLSGMLLDEQRVSVLEVFYEFEPITPLMHVMHLALPEKLYERAIF